MCFASVKLNTLLTKSNPSITQTVISNYFRSNDVFSFDKLDFKIAFGVESVAMNGYVPKNDPNLIKWFAVYNKNGGDYQATR